MGSVAIAAAVITLHLPSAADNPVFIALSTTTDGFKVDVPMPVVNHTDKYGEGTGSFGNINRTRWGISKFGLVVRTLTMNGIEV